MSKFTKILAVALALIATSYVAKADSFTGTAGTGDVIFSGVDVYDVNSSASSNPFGLTQVTCRGGGPCGSKLGGSFEVATIIFFQHRRLHYQSVSERKQWRQRRRLGEHHSNH
jgi:hypothetical protein